MTPYSIIRALLFRLDPETAHEATLSLMNLGLRGPFASVMHSRVPDKPCQVMGLTFPNRIGMAAGMDKNADHINALGALGFGHIEVGTLTPVAQDGNPIPRLFRLPEYEAIINRMGFNNKGIDFAIEHIKHRRYRGILGINIGKNKITPNEKAVGDYLVCLRKAYTYADYIAVNISSPNTPGLRELQGAEELERLLDALQTERENLVTLHKRRVPLAVKIAPDIDATAMDTIADCALRFKLDGLIVGNTTITRPAVASSSLAKETGGLSGKPLRSLSTTILREMHQRLENKIALIGSGGVSSGEDAVEKLQAGASLVQIYTGLIYQGPGLIRELTKATNNYLL
ncbi:MAG: quinone-dependent dihydroorotate dehydrogenase [Gammaproteobacteria bacterium]|nr:quinone-dependent dihydroorotate dehydrogenase [Gammaproteobacteria bacterium]